MNTITTVLHRLIFAVTCLLGWIAFPMLIVSGAAALFCYALIGELFSSMADEVYEAPDDSLEDTSVRRICGPMHP